MNRFLWAVVAVAAYLIAAEALNCNRCSAGIFGRCIIGSTETCSGSGDVCYTASANFNVSGILSISRSGCFSNNNSTNCTDSTGSILGAGYTITRTCCSTDLCNDLASGATSSTKMSLTASLGAALVAAVLGSYAH